MNKLTNLPAYILLRILCFLLMLLPLWVTYLLARFIGALVFHVFRFRRHIVMGNLQIAFGNEIQSERLKKIALESYKQTAMTFLELLIAPKLQKRFQEILTPEQKEFLRDLLKQGRGLMVVSGHLGNWELLGAAIATVMDEPFTVAAAQQSNLHINRFITRRRNSMGMQVAGRKQAMKLLLRGTLALFNIMQMS